MTVREIYLADRSIFNVSGVGYDPHAGKLNYVGGQQHHAENSTLKKLLLEVCYKCNESTLVEEDGYYHILGDPTEGAMLTLYYKAKENRYLLEERKGLEKPDVEEIFPFDSERKMMSVIDEGKVLVKGSPDQVLEKCTHWTDGEKIHEFTPQKRQQIQKHYERMAENALRVLACAERRLGTRHVTEGDIPKDNASAEKDLVFLGLVGMIDPPRDEVSAAIKECRTAGIRVIVITGDYGITAKAIARELGIVRGKNVRVLTGERSKRNFGSRFVGYAQRPK